MEYMYFNQRVDISSINGSSLKLVNKVTYLESGVSSTETDINTQLAIAWTTIDDTQFLPSSDRVDTAIWMHYMDSNYTNGEKAWWQRHKNASSNIE